MDKKQALIQPSKIMDRFCETFNQAYPNFQISHPSNECVIMEPTVSNSNSDFLSLKVVGNNLRDFRYEFAGGTTSFYEKAKSPDPLRSNCDGIFLAQKDGRNIIFFCELKSSFSEQEICHAKEQLVGTLLRTKAQLAILQKNCNFEIHGVIVSYAPTSENLSYVAKQTGPRGFFLQNLCSRNHHDMNAAKCAAFYDPWNVPSFRIHYVQVPIHKQHYTISIDDLLAI